MEQGLEKEKGKKTEKKTEGRFFRHSLKDGKRTVPPSYFYHAPAPGKINECKTPYFFS